MIDKKDPIVKQRATINPYIHGAALIVRRLLWDIRPESWRSRQKIRSWKDKYKGQKAVIVCNGPSLLKSDLSLLDDVFTFGLNKINLLFDKSDFRPSCVVAVNPFVIEQNENFFNTTNIPLFLDSVGIKHIKSRKNIIFLPSAHLPRFARDCSISINQGATVTYAALQLAFYMGFKEVALIGADHNFAVKGPANKTVVSGDKDESHFDPNYFAGGVKWQLPDLFQSEVSYMMAKQVYEAFDRKVVNATEGGCLEIFPKISLDEFVAEK
ncbi:6-hydroxymethylpterin diphosphokinase MptE-like protein [Lutibacter sp.]